MSNFPAWFNRSYKRWSRSQAGEEDFIAFCDLLGYSPATVLSWLHGESIPQGAEILSIAGLLGIKVYEVLGQPEPDPELLKIYTSFTHLTSEYRSKLTNALYEVEQTLQKENLSINSPNTKEIFKEVFSKWGVDEGK